MCTYKHSPESIQSARRLVGVKIERQNVLLKKYKKAPITLNRQETPSIKQVLLLEARAAKQFWCEFRDILLSYPDFRGRKPRAMDVSNRLLDVGYHHLTNIVKKLLEQHDMSPALGLLHIAHAADSTPLAYDLVELFRTDIVDAEVLRFLRLKKKTLVISGQKDIAHFLHEVNERLERKYYLKDFKTCQTYRYYMELQILKFGKAVNHKQVFTPLHLPTRHDVRCRPHILTTPSPMLS